jgi:hypothetical protein
MGQIPDDPLWKAGIGECTSTQCHERGARLEILPDIGCRAYTSASDDGHPGSLNNPRDSKDPNREKHWSADPAIALPQSRMPIGTKEETRQRIHRCHGIGAGISGDQSYCSNIGKYWGELRDEWSAGSGTTG